MSGPQARQAAAEATLAAALAEGAARLRAAGIEAAAGDARRLLAHAAHLAPARLSLSLDTPLSAPAASRFEAALAERLARRPVAQIVGARLFWGRPFAVTGAVLDPRPETETLIEAALAGGPARRLVDLGTGSGAIALTLLAEWPQAEALATDASAAALEVARANAAALDVAGRCRFRRADWWRGVEGRFDLIAANPPYIPDAELAGLAPELAWEPRMALSSGPDGLAAIAAILHGAGRHLAPGGRLLCEFGAGQGPRVAALAARAGLAQIRLSRDLDGRDRVLVARSGV